MVIKRYAIILGCLALYACKGDREGESEIDSGASDPIVHFETTIGGDSIRVDTLPGQCFSSRSIVEGGKTDAFTFFNYCDTVWSYRFSDSVEHSYYRKFASYIEPWGGDVAGGRIVSDDSTSLKLTLPELPSRGVRADIQVVRLGPGRDSTIIDKASTEGKHVEVTYEKLKREVDSVVVLLYFVNDDLGVRTPPLPAKLAFVMNGEDAEPSLRP